LQLQPALFKIERRVQLESCSRAKGEGWSGLGRAESARAIGCMAILTGRHGRRHLCIRPEDSKYLPDALPGGKSSPASSRPACHSGWLLVGFGVNLPQSVISSASGQGTLTTAVTQGSCIFIDCSIPAFKVRLALGQCRQVPRSLTEITPPSTQTSSTSPPSTCMAPRRLLRTASISSVLVIRHLLLE
jgi:hypothetical protein